MEEIKVPKAGQSVEEAEIVDWFKQEGDSVAAGEPLFSIQTDKAEIECESTASGVLRKILVQPGQEVPVLTVAALVGTADEPLPDLSKYETGGAKETEPAAAPAKPGGDGGSQPKPAPGQASAPAQPSAEAAVSPRARKLAEGRHVNAKALQGHGAGGRVMAADVQAYLEQLDSARITPTARRIAAAQGLDLRGIQGTGAGGKITKADVADLAAAPAPAEGETKRAPLSPMRKTIAERMSASKFSAPHYYVTVEVDMSAGKALRATLPYKVSFNDLVLFATMRALLEYPHVNARWAGDAIEQVAEINLGMAVALPEGLIVPVLKGAQHMDLQRLSQDARALAEKAQAGKLMPDDYIGNTFTVSNLGAFGVDNFTAIINQPDSAIIAVGQIKDRPVVIDGGIHVRPIMKLTMSSDHRVIDGAVAAQFMGRLKEILEAAAFA